jgi:hypothetical protein
MDLALVEHTAGKAVKSLRHMQKCTCSDYLHFAGMLQVLLA